jgi:hypothetical protein
MSLTDVNLFRIDGTLGSVSNISTASLNGGPLAGTRNRIINGDMRIDQRNAGASVTVNSSNNFYAVDRWQLWYRSSYRWGFYCSAVNNCADGI